MCSAAVFHDVMTPLRSLLTIASSDESTMAARRARTLWSSWSGFSELLMPPPPEPSHAVRYAPTGMIPAAGGVGRDSLGRMRKVLPYRAGVVLRAGQRLPFREPG